MNLNQLFESLSADQRRAGQLPANFQAPNTSPQLAGPYPGKNATRGYLVGEGVRDLGYDAQSLIMKLRRDVEEKRLQPTRQAVLSAARELAGDMNVAPELLVRQVLRQGVAEGLPQTLRKFVPGYAKREIDKKMDDGKFGRRDVDRDANYYRYKKIQDKIADKDVAEAMKPSDIPPSMRQRLTMRDVEAERPRGAFRFRVTFPDGSINDYMTFDAAKSAADQEQGRISQLSENDQDAEMQDFLARGGKIQHEPGRMPRLGTRLRQHGSRHIGQGREPRAGQLAGRGANINVQGGKPVVTAEGLQPGEYHVATVTLDDGTVKRVRITTDEGFRDGIQKHFQKQGHTVTDIDVDYAVRSDLGENKPRFVDVPSRPQPYPIGGTKILPPAPGRPGMVGGPREQQRRLEQDLARRMASEDVLGDVQRRLSDVLQQRLQRQAERMPQRQVPQDVLGDPVKKIDLGDGNVLMIHGNEDDGFRIHLGQRVMPTRFDSMEQAEMMTRVYEARLAERKEPLLRKTARSSRIMQQLRAQYPEAQTDLEALLYDFRRGQTQDRRDINRLDFEIDTEEAEIDQLQVQLNRLKKQRGTADDLDEAKKDACYHKVKAASKIWPSAYASGRLVQCRKKGAANYGNKSKK